MPRDTRSTSRSVSPSPTRRAADGGRQPRTATSPGSGTVSSGLASTSIMCRICDRLVPGAAFQKHSGECAQRATCELTLHESCRRLRHTKAEVAEQMMLEKDDAAHQLLERLQSACTEACAATRLSHLRTLEERLPQLAAALSALQHASVRIQPLLWRVSRELQKKTAATAVLSRLRESARHDSTGAFAPSDSGSESDGVALSPRQATGNLVDAAERLFSTSTTVESEGGGGAPVGGGVPIGSGASTEQELACSEGEGSGAYSSSLSSSPSLSSSAAFLPPLPAQQTDGPPALRVPRLSDFELIKWITRGGYGQVLLVRKKTTGDLYAMKVMSKRKAAQRPDRVWAERQVLAMTHSDFVARLFYACQTPTCLLMLMEYCPGGDLFSLREALYAFPLNMARHYLAEVVLAVRYLHSIGVVHRDLKPDNLLIAADGHLKLIDFGLSKLGLVQQHCLLRSAPTTPLVRRKHRRLMRRKRQSRSLPKSAVTDATVDAASESYSCAGTPEYLAPEVLLGLGHAHQADWWAVGVMLFEFLTGVPPFYGETPGEVFAAILEHDLQMPEEDVDEVSADLIRRLLDANPSTRLGANGAKEIMRHPFFASIDWETVRTKPAPFIPSLTSSEDTTYFDPRSEFFGMAEPTSVEEAIASLDRQEGCDSSATSVQTHGTSQFGDFWFVSAENLAALNRMASAESGI